jgi:hypothetical protein
MPLLPHNAACAGSQQKVLPYCSMAQTHPHHAWYARLPALLERLQKLLRCTVTRPQAPLPMLPYLG